MQHLLNSGRETTKHSNRKKVVKPDFWCFGAPCTSPTQRSNKWKYHILELRFSVQYVLLSHAAQTHKLPEAAAELRHTKTSAAHLNSILLFSRCITAGAKVNHMFNMQVPPVLGGLLGRKMSHVAEHPQLNVKAMAAQWSQRVYSNPSKSCTLHMTHVNHSCADQDCGY